MKTIDGEDFIVGGRYYAFSTKFCSSCVDKEIASCIITEAEGDKEDFIIVKCRWDCGTENTHTINNSHYSIRFYKHHHNIMSLYKDFFLERADEFLRLYKEQFGGENAKQIL